MVEAAVGPHARYRTVSSIDFAGGYADGASASRSLFARNQDRRTWRTLGLRRMSSVSEIYGDGTAPVPPRKTLAGQFERRGL
ncbi:MAG: hypothetical protein M3480_08195, partial [Verrucomicrobiota bacterium]|nr:hypothetical protein [Verrucomicrobiota bacterium]